MSQLFVSYSRENKVAVDELVGHFAILGHQTWVDSSLRGGDDWWQEILRRISSCDVFIAIVSRDALNSVACQREFDWAEALGKPVLPVAVEQLPSALPRRISMRQVVDYSQPGQDAALRLAGSLGAVPAAPPLPAPLPEPPAAPLSYLTDLVDQATGPSALDHAVQWQIISQLEPALRSVDPEERRGGIDVLDRLRGRKDLYADVDRALAQMAAVQKPIEHDETQRSVRTSAAVEHTEKVSGTPRPNRTNTSPHQSTAAALRTPGLLFIVAAVLCALLAVTELFLDPIAGLPSFSPSLYPEAGYRYFRSSVIPYFYVLVWLATAVSLVITAVKTRSVRSGMAVGVTTVAAGIASIAALVLAVVPLFTTKRCVARQCYVYVSDLLDLKGWAALIFFVVLIAFGVAAWRAVGQWWMLFASAAGIAGFLGPINPAISFAWPVFILLLGIFMYRSEASPSPS